MDKTQAVSIPEGAVLVQMGTPLAEMLPGPITHVVIGIEMLKPERVQEPEVDAEEEAGAGFVFELTVHQPQPVTIELNEPKITILLHGNPAGAAQAA